MSVVVVDTMFVVAFVNATAFEFSHDFDVFVDAFYLYGSTGTDKHTTLSAELCRYTFLFVGETKPTTFLEYQIESPDRVCMSNLQCGNGVYIVLHWGMQGISVHSDRDGEAFIE